MSVTCKYCPLIEGEKLKREGQQRGLKGKAITQLEKLGEKSEYVHKPTLQRHVGDSKSLHNWCKQQVTGEENVCNSNDGSTSSSSMSGDGSEARKTSSEKELVYAKVLVNGFKGYIPCTFLLKCQTLKNFGGANAEGTFKAMLDVSKQASKQTSEPASKQASQQSSFKVTLFVSLSVCHVTQQTSFKVLKY